MRIKIGCDPELFLHNGMEYVSAHEGFPGTKREPFKLEKGAVQVDGTALEFNIDPAENADEFDGNIKIVLKQMEDMVRKVDQSLAMTYSPVAEYEEIYFALLPVSTKALGCEPDFDVNGEIKTPSEELLRTPVRTAAGHIHIGWTEGENPFDEKHFERCKTIAKAFVGQRFFTPRTPLERQRVKYYGVPGSFRPKPYGVELRTPSNLWVARSAHRKQMFNLVHKRVQELSL